MNLQEEADYWNKEHFRCFGVHPVPLISPGVPNAHVAKVQSAVMRHWVEAAKQVVRSAGGGYVPRLPK